MAMPASTALPPSRKNVRAGLRELRLRCHDHRLLRVTHDCPSRSAFDRQRITYSERASRAARHRRRVSALRCGPADIPRGDFADWPLDGASVADIGRCFEFGETMAQMAPSWSSRCHGPTVEANRGTEAGDRRQANPALPGRAAEPSCPTPRCWSCCFQASGGRRRVRDVAAQF